MLVEIRKTDFTNKGSELMLIACLQAMKAAFPHAAFAVTPNVFANPYQKRAVLGLYQKVSFWRHRLQLGDLAAILPIKLRQLYGLVLDKEIDLVLDAAGFAYSDQWGIEPSIELAASCVRWKKSGTKVVLLPQSLGPFTSDRIKSAITVVADNTDFIFARDRESYGHIVSVVGERPNIRQAPDITNLVNVEMTDAFDFVQGGWCIIPNLRMIDKTSEAQKQLYLPFLAECINYLLRRNKSPFILVHEDGDIGLAEEISRISGHNIPFATESDPLKIKSIIGKCQCVIGSRYHALLGALSQGIPALALGWSHKYDTLFEEYGFIEGIMNLEAEKSEIHSKLDMIIETAYRADIADRLLKISIEHKKTTEKMWMDLFLYLKSNGF